MTDPLHAATHHVNLVVVHHDASTQKKGKHQFVFLKQAATYITIEAEGEIFIDVPDSLLHCVCVKHVKKKRCYHNIVHIWFSYMYIIKQFL